MKSVKIVELGLMDRMLPLLGGYLEAYAGQDPWLRSSYRIQKKYFRVREDRDVIMRELLDGDTDVYAFSCYVWNTGLARSIARELLDLRPHAQFILGGPQVMHQAARLHELARDNVTICDGEGEVTFSNYLRELTEPHPDRSKVRGVSFYVDGRVVTTEKQPRVTAMDDIPSPFLNGMFQGQFRVATIETNRGCPFHCSFCYWGAATNDRVHQFSEARVKDELTWIAKTGIPFLFIADANWGMQKRDVELSRHLGDCHRRYDYPQTVYYSAAKNSPERVCEIVEILDNSHILATQPISLQTLDDQALKQVSRQNIKKGAFILVQERLTERKISSFTELIWPLPGETLDSFRRGLDTLFKMASNAHTLIVYPHLLLINTPMYHQREELGLVTRRIGDGRCESELIVETGTVSYADYQEGLRFNYSALLLYCFRGLHTTMGYLDRQKIANYGDVLLDFVRFWGTQKHSRIVEFVEGSIERLEVVRYNNFGATMHYALDEHRAEYAAMLGRFIASLPCYSDPNIRFLFELDRVLTPYVYSSTPITVDAEPFEYLEVARTGPRAFEITVPEPFRELAADIMSRYGTPRLADTERYTIDHERQQFPYWKSRGLDGNADYCYAMLNRIERIIPTCAAELSRDDQSAFAGALSH